MKSVKVYFDPVPYKPQLNAILTALDSMTIINHHRLTGLLKKYPKDGKGLFTKTDLIVGFRHYHKQLNLKTPQDQFVDKIRKKPIRTMSGVAPVTVLTKPFPCPGKCIFCPNDIRMPKSYLSDEPGAQRATRNNFDPYLQTYDRIQSFDNNGHSIDKIELIILGGTWSFYPEPYQIWFIKRCFDAINDYGNGFDSRDHVQKASDFTDMPTSSDIDGLTFNTTYNQVVSKKLVTDIGGKLLNHWEQATWEELELAQHINETNPCRNVGLVIETRPDYISEAEVLRIRRLGCTKTQIGYQSLSDHVLEVNKRGHNVAATRRAMRLLRAAGFKIHAHWMANLYGSSVTADIADYQTMFSDPDFKPDELKIYPCSLIQTAELMQYYQKGLWHPYSHQDLLQVVTACIHHTPRYCRLTRIIRDIPSQDIVVGNKKTNFRQIAESHLKSTHTKTVDIRSREIKDQKFDVSTLKLKTTTYHTSTSTEKFLEYVTPDDHIVGFLRLSFPKADVPISRLTNRSVTKSANQPVSQSAITSNNQLTNQPVNQAQPKADRPIAEINSIFIPELINSAIIREVHVYGYAAQIGERRSLKAQHLGLGTKLVNKAIQISKKAKYKNLAVISAIGTRGYYRKLGFTDGKLYQHYKLS